MWLVNRNSSVSKFLPFFSGESAGCKVPLNTLLVCFEFVLDAADWPAVPASVLESWFPALPIRLQFTGQVKGGG